MQEFIALEAALDFWQRAAGDERITPGFRQICAQNAEHLERLRAVRLRTQVD